MLTRTVRLIVVAAVVVLPAAVCAGDEISDLKDRVAALEKRVEDLERALRGSKAQAATGQLRAGQQQRARQRMRRDAETYSPGELHEIETLYQVANRNWQSPEAQESLKKLVEKYKRANRTGCAILYLGQMSRGDEQIAYFKQAIADYGDCFYGDGVQVGPMARFLLARAYLAGVESNEENAEKAKRLFDEIRKDYPEAVDHRGNSLVEQLPAGKSAEK
jgi:tetratricopeptide (TPR) repeat protein